MKIEQVTPEL